MREGILDTSALDGFHDEDGFEAAVIVRLMEERDAYREIAIEKAWDSLDLDSSLNRESLGDAVDLEVIEQIGFSDELSRFKKEDLCAQ